VKAADGARRQVQRHQRRFRAVCSLDHLQPTYSATMR
jgi:hypothetical protein